MITWVYGKEKIGLAVVRADPRTIEPYFGCFRPDITNVRISLLKLEDINQGFAGFWLRGRVLFLIGLHTEIDLRGAAPGRGTSGSSIVLCKNWRCEEKDCKHGFHHVGVTRDGAGGFLGRVGIAINSRSDWRLPGRHVLGRRGRRE